MSKNHNQVPASGARFLKDYAGEGIKAVARSDQAIYADLLSGLQEELEHWMDAQDDVISAAIDKNPDVEQPFLKIDELLYQISVITDAVDDFQHSLQTGFVANSATSALMQTLSPEKVLAISAQGQALVSEAVGCCAKEGGKLSPLDVSFDAMRNSYEAASLEYCESTFGSRVFHDEIMVRIDELFASKGKGSPSATIEVKGHEADGVTQTPDTKTPSKK